MVLFLWLVFFVVSCKRLKLFLFVKLSDNFVEEDRKVLKVSNGGGKFCVLWIIIFFKCNDDFNFNKLLIVRRCGVLINGLIFVVCYVF